MRGRTSDWLAAAAARTDPKTGLLNATAWQREADAEVARAQRTNSPLALLLVDVDHFKGVNDSHGHLIGDEVLRALLAELHALDAGGPTLARPELAAWRRRDWLRGRTLRVPVAGTAEGIAADGALRVRRADATLELVRSGDATPAIEF